MAKFTEEEKKEREQVRQHKYYEEHKEEIRKRQNADHWKNRDERRAKQNASYWKNIGAGKNKRGNKKLAEALRKAQESEDV